LGRFPTRAAETEDEEWCQAPTLGQSVRVALAAARMQAV